MGCELEALLFSIVVGICCNSGLSNGIESVAKQGFIVSPRNPFFPQTRPFNPFFQPRPFSFPPLPRRRFNNIFSQTSGMQLAMVVLLERIFDDSSNNDEDSLVVSDAPEPTVDCDWGEWGSCSLSTTSCGTRRRIKRCDGDTEVQSESCNVPTGFRDIDGEQWYLAANCYEYYISDTRAKRPKSSAQCQERNGAMLASRGFRDVDIRTDVMTELRIRAGSAAAVWVGVRGTTTGDYLWDDGDTSAPTFYGLQPSPCSGPCNSLAFGPGPGPSKAVGPRSDPLKAIGPGPGSSAALPPLPFPLLAPDPGVGPSTALGSGPGLSAGCGPPRCHLMVTGNSFSLRRLPCLARLRYICERPATT